MLEVIVFLMLVGGVGWYLYLKSTNVRSPTPSNTTTTQRQSSDARSSNRSGDNWPHTEENSNWSGDPSRDVRRDDADYWLEWRETADGQSRGYLVVRSEDGHRYDWPVLKQRIMLQGIGVAGESYHMEDLQGDAFAPGSRLSLAPEPENPHGTTSVAVKSADESLHVGYVPTEKSERIFNELLDGMDLRCISLWEVRRDGERVSLRILIARPDTDVAWPG